MNRQGFQCGTDCDPRAFATRVANGGGAVIFIAGSQHLAALILVGTTTLYVTHENFARCVNASTYHDMTFKAWYLGPITEEGLERWKARQNKQATP